MMQMHHICPGPQEMADLRQDRKLAPGEHTTPDTERRRNVFCFDAVTARKGQVPRRHDPKMQLGAEQE